jgi:hypothetical protein
VQADVCMTFRGVGWAGLQHAEVLLGEELPRIAYANGDLLLMSPGLTHEAYATAFQNLVLAVGRSDRIRTRSLGSALWSLMSRKPTISQCAPVRSRPGSRRGADFTKLYGDSEETTESRAKKCR